MIASPSDAPLMGATSEVGRLDTVMLHRPGSELRRLTPRNNDQLLFDGVPWVDRAQAEHDAFADALRAHGVEVLYARELLEETLAAPAAREQLLEAALDPQLIGPTLADRLRERLPPPPPPPPRARPGAPPPPPPPPPPRSRRCWSPASRTRSCRSPAGWSTA